MITIDIETRPDDKISHIFLDNIKAPANIKDPEKIKANIEAKKGNARKSLSVDQDYSEIVCIGCKIDDEPAKLVSLEELVELMISHEVLTFNGKNFDIPVILKHVVKKGIKTGISFAPLIKRWQSDKHKDLMEQLACNGNYKSLDEYLQIYLGIKKTPCDFETCTQEELEAHCIEDVENTYKLYQLFKNLI